MSNVLRTLLITCVHMSQWISHISSQVVQAFAKERRRIVSDWRVLLAARRLAQADGAPLPTELKSNEVVDYLLRRGELSSLEGVRGVYRIDVPFAQILPTSDEQIVQEAHPWAVFSCLTALVHHQLTDEIPKNIYATDYGRAQGRRIPLGTTPEDWIDLELPPAKCIARASAADVQWWRTKIDWDFGDLVAHSQGVPIYVTDLERTLLDVLRAPEYAGAITVVLSAWREAKTRMNVPRLVDYVERFNSAVLRQRVGFLLDHFRMENPRRQAWLGRLQRGGSMKLVAAESYSSIYSETWNLSLNVPDSLLQQLKD